ncbi:unnamed protein product [Bursaphelenchus okinawaensis]|uniref:Uncharacterized protein n=1 Tax=Bursaphelenchus okinawaensis TaxID=465554 RepID=A0A811JV00_9BILA|nr:unnamed protein product [Bursaphelenchus okinawaensis]CAG9085083.1 unnamed protein product [Bursaphelenchus okinawaensis]
MMTAKHQNLTVPPNVMAMLTYTFDPDKTLIDQQVRLIVNITYTDSNQRPFVHTVFDKTISIQEDKYIVKWDTKNLVLFMVTYSVTYQVFSSLMAMCCPWLKSKLRKHNPPGEEPILPQHNSPARNPIRQENVPLDKNFN